MLLRFIHQDKLGCVGLGIDLLRSFAQTGPARPVMRAQALRVSDVTGGGSAGCDRYLSPVGLDRG